MASITTRATTDAFRVGKALTPGLLKSANIAPFLSPILASGRVAASTTTISTHLSYNSQPSASFSTFSQQNSQKTHRSGCVCCSTGHSSKAGQSIGANAINSGATHTTQSRGFSRGRPGGSEKK